MDNSIAGVFFKTRLKETVNVKTMTGAPLSKNKDQNRCYPAFICRISSVPPSDAMKVDHRTRRPVEDTSLIKNWRAKES